jgi:hypothetical protein
MKALDVVKKIQKEEDAITKLSKVFRTNNKRRRQLLEKARNMKIDTHDYLAKARKLLSENNKIAKALQGHYDSISECYKLLGRRA